MTPPATLAASPPATLGDCVAAARSALPRPDADVLTAHAVGCARNTLYAFPERPVSTADTQRLGGFLDRRQRGEPVAYILGEREFWSLPLRVDARVLIPRPETECLVEAALEHIEDGTRVLDLGTGSGAVALAVATARPDADVVGVDLDPGCIDVARENAKELGVTVQFVQSDWFSALEAWRRFDVILANPPYVADGDPHLARGDLRFEPRHALAGGPDGLTALRQLIGAAPAWLASGGWLLVEHGHDQQESVLPLFLESGFEDIETRQDLAGIDRVAGGRAPRE